MQTGRRTSERLPVPECLDAGMAGEIAEARDAVDSRRRELRGVVQ